MTGFRLYPHEQHWWSFADYQAVLDVMASIQPARVLEFGPGASTLALIEGGARAIDTCESEPAWADVHEARVLAPYRDLVTLHRYEDRDPVTVPTLPEGRFDLALVDGPRETARRVSTIQFAAARSAHVVVPIDGSEVIRQCVVRLPGQVRWKKTGPLAGEFAVVTLPW